MPCNLGPSQTARAMTGVDRRHLAFVNQRHVTEEKLNEAITTVVNAYVRIGLQARWGSGRTASADGTKWELYPQNLISQYHIRYGGYGGLGYYLVADSYVALFSRFIACGTYEGYYILDFINENRSDVQPETIHSIPTARVKRFSAWPISWTLDKSNPFRFEKAVIPDEPERISERLKPPFSGETGV